MKRALGLLMILCLLTSLFVSAFAAGGVAITKQPESQTVKKGGKVTFSFKSTGQTAITWYFVNPETGEAVPCSQIKDYFKGVRVSGQNSYNLRLSKVPEDLHGWFFYVKIKGNGKTVQSNYVQLLVKGLPEPAYAAPVTPEPVTKKKKSTKKTTTKKTTTASSESGEDGGDEDEPEATPEPTPEPYTPPWVLAEMEAEAQIIKHVNITAQNGLIFALDENGEETGEGSPTMSFENEANFVVKPAEGVEVLYWTVDGKRVDALEEKYENVTETMAFVGRIRTAADIEAASKLDYNNMCTVSCTGCFFTFVLDDMIKVSSGQVPAGAVITVITGEPNSASGRKRVVNKGYSINGGKFEHVDEATFQLTITEDTTISMKQ